MMDILPFSLTSEVCLRRRDAIEMLQNVQELDESQELQSHLLFYSLEKRGACNAENK